MNAYFLEKPSYFHPSPIRSRSAPAAVRFRITHTDCSYKVTGGQVDWILSDGGVLYMKKWNGLDNDALKGLSLPYAMK